MNTARLKTILVLVVAIVAFNLGRYSVEFSGSVTAWIAVVAGLVALVLSLFVLIREFWKSDA
jgi:hypothetical protein